MKDIDITKEVVIIIFAIAAIWFFVYFSMLSASDLIKCIIFAIAVVYVYEKFG